MKTAPADFIRMNTSISAPPHVPEIYLHLADEAHDLWHRTEEELGEIGLPPPFWAFAWAGGQGLARHILAHPDLVSGKSVLDFACGSGLVAIAAAKAGAKHVEAVDIDPWAIAATGLNAAVNEVGGTISVSGRNVVGTEGSWDVVLAGDVFYDAEMTGMIAPWFESLARNGTRVLVGDPGRAYRPKTGFIERAVYSVPVTRVLEDSEVKRTAVLECVPD
ncbi:methyltransferase [Pseudohoeflea suaedae]|uniref:Methyltransferase n=1 Tax=Pseudohoeflea suaedae TaxID=877384 RepID=A0A4R5PQE6_9HYPH|nr:methyltransferase [Pseudohoeflea suaedae]TDH39364.1 methyltransferase [Pseudohoeflea suaedae]